MLDAKTRAKNGAWWAAAGPGARFAYEGSVVKEANRLRQGWHKETGIKRNLKLAESTKTKLKNTHLLKHTEIAPQQKTQSHCECSPVAQQLPSMWQVLGSVPRTMRTQTHKKRQSSFIFLNQWVSSKHPKTCLAYHTSSMIARIFCRPWGKGSQQLN